MLNLGPLFDAPADEARFQKFHRENPEVYAELARLARQALAAGRTRIGIRMLWERMRWSFTVETVRREGDYKLNNNLTSRYARLLMQESDLSEIFETRDSG